MSRNIIILVLFFVTLTINGRSAKKVSETKKFSPEWETNNSVKKLYDTPLGEVFRFTPTNPFLSNRDNRKLADNQLNTIQFELYKNSREREKIKRFIVIDFKMRVFPAISESENPRLYFVLTRSTNGASSIEKLKNINGQVAFSNYFWMPIIKTLTLSTQSRSRKRKSKHITIKRSTYAFAYLGRSFLPFYEIVSMRIIIDRSEKGIITSNINQALYWTQRQESSQERVYPVRSFGILVTDIKVKKLGKNRRIIELSRPQVTFTNNEASLQDLPPIKFEKYPYDGYLSQAQQSKKRRKRNPKRLNNPDEIYAHALNLLKGQDLIEGVKLLTYIAKRKEHILAMNQLGICYWRGIGVKPNYEKALTWFRRAGKYYLPDAMAYGGASRLTEAPKPYLKEYTKKYITSVLKQNGLEYNSGKHSSSVLSAMLNYAPTGGPKEYERSAKLGYWIAKNYFLETYYKNRIYKDEGLRISSKGMLKSRYKKNRFYDIRKKYIGGWIINKTTSRKVIDNAVDGKFPAAIYFKGQLLIAESTKGKRKSAVKEAMAIFELGEKIYDPDCALEVMHCKARLGLLKLEDFDKETYAKYSDYPLYYLLRYIVKHPKAPGVKEFLNGDYRKARAVWRKKSDGMSNFLLALEGIYQYFHYGANTAMYRIYYGHIHDLNVAYKHLDKAVKAKIPNALYLKGVYYLNKKYNHSVGLRSGDIQSGINLLRKIASKNIKAQYYIIKNDFYKNKRRNQKQLEQLKPLLNLKYPEAWLLYSDILASLTQGSFKKKKLVIDAYKKAAGLGCVRAWDRLARLYYTQAKQSYRSNKTQNENKAAMIKYWKKFLEEDNKQRRNNPLDPYWPKPKPPEVINKRSNGYVPIGIVNRQKNPEGYKLLFKYLSKYYKFGRPKSTNNSSQILKGGPRDKGSVGMYPPGRSFEFK